MNIKLPTILGLVIACLHQPAFAQGTAFTYQGRLNDGASPANGTYDLQFMLFDAASGGTQQSGTWTQLAQGVTNGLFTVTLDFGGFFPGADRWLDIGVRTNGGGGFTTLTPRQKFTTTPYAITAGSLSGNITSAQLPIGVLTNGASGVTLTGSFTGNGANVSNVNAAALGGLGSSNFWQTAGNAGTTAGLHFLGTTDNQPLEFKVNGVRALRFEPVVASGGSFISAPNVVGGWAGNQIINGAVGATIWGGGFDFSTDYGNNVGADFGTVSGGRQNTAGGAEATVAGGRANAANGGNATIGGGYANSATGDYSAVGGGQFNNSVGTLATIAGGYNNRIQTNAVAAIIAGGHNNLIQSNASYSMIGSGGFHVIETNAYDSIIGGGGYNKIQNDANSTVIAGGSANLIGPGSVWAAIGGGGNNTNKSLWATIAGGANNNIQTNSHGAAIGGGFDNTIGSNAFAASIGGGRGNLIETGAFDSTISGGPYNLIQTNANAATIGGGYINLIGPSAGASTIAGGVGNSIQSNAIGSAISGGYFNFIQLDAHSSFIGGGTNNSIAATRSVVGGGEGNSARGEYSTIGGGGFNQATGRAAFVGGGGGRDALGGGPYTNTASGDWSTIGGGWFHVSSGYSSTVGGGANNLATNTLATVPGGGANIAGGYSSFAAGQGAHALHTGAFVWSDSQNGNFASTANGQFLVRAGGGVGINKNNPTTALDVNGTVTASGFSGPGGNLTGLNASQITSGTLPDARLSANIATLNGAQTFTGAKTFNAPSTFNNFVGIGTSTAIGAGSLIVSANTPSFAGMYVNSGASGQPFYGYAQGGGIAAFSYVDGTDANKWKLSVAGNRVTVTPGGNVGIGTTGPQSPLHLYSANNPTVMRIQSSGAPGFGRVEFVSNPQGDVNEWRPGYIESSDNGGFTGGLRFVVNGTGSGNKFAEVETMRIVNGGVGIGTATPVSALQVVGTVTATAFNPPSDRNLKENFAPVSPQEVLEKVAALPISRWNFKGDVATPHVGPMAQDFHAAFGLGTDERHIATVDADGVALAAIQGLNQKLEERNSEIRSLKSELEQLKELVNKLASTKE